MHEQSFTNQQPQQYTFKVGNITGQGVTLVDTQYNIIQLPLSILPHGSTSGTIIKITLMRDVEAENREEKKLTHLMEKLENGGENIVDAVNDKEGESQTIEEKEISEKPAVQVKQEKQTKKDGMKKKTVVQERQPKIMQTKQIQKKTTQRQNSQYKSKQKSIVQRSSSSKKTPTLKSQDQTN